MLLALLAPDSALAAPRLIGPIGLVISMPDAYTTPFHTTLVVAAPGVLANDLGLLSQPTAELVSGTTKGTLTLAANGGFQYQPNGGFSGVDTFKYFPKDVLLSGATTTVTITVAAPLPTPSPTPTALPTPGPTSTPTATPTPSPTPSPTPTSALPTFALPTPTLAVLPLPTPTLTVLPLPTFGPPTLPTPTPAPGSTSPGGPTVPPLPLPTPTPDPSGDPSSTAAPSSRAIGVPPGVGGPTGGTGSSGGASSRGEPTLGLTIPIRDPGDGPLAFGSFGGLGIGFEWVVPSVLVSVPGFLLIIVGLAQASGGFVWLPVARRWLHGDGRRSAAPARRLTT